MSDDIKPQEGISDTDNKAAFAIKLIFQPAEPNTILRLEESQLLRSYFSEILEEIEIEEKLILEEERKAALEVTVRNSKKEDQ